MKVLEERLVYLFTLFCKDLLCSCFHFGSRTFICMSNIFVFPPPSPMLFFFWVLVNSLILIWHSVNPTAFSDADRASSWMTKSSSGFASLCWSSFGRAQTSLFHYVPFIHWLPSPDFRIRSIQMGCDLYIHFRKIRDVFSTNFSVVVLCFLFLFGFDSKHPVGSRYPGLILDSICALLRASQLPADLTVVCTRSGVFQ